ncbi:Ku protein [Kineococcus gypseus]|uniref:non-homologous end joining protein Ku n=1 Tax=Kineococcus gypseus TaxID=1637102 RepID=UPI003D7D6E65
MARAVWKGAVSFGLVHVPVRLHPATVEHDIRFHQVHRSDGGRIRLRRTCEVCGEEVPLADVARAYEAPDGRVAVLAEEDLERLPVPGEHVAEVLRFVPADQVDPVLLGRAHFVEPEPGAARAYALLRSALAATDRVALVRFALRRRESLGVLRVRGEVVVLQSLAWPDEVQPDGFDVLRADVELRLQELRTAATLVEAMSGDLEPEQLRDEQTEVLRRLVEARLRDPAAPAPGGGGGQDAAEDVVDLLGALQRSVERARAARAGERGEDAGEGSGEDGVGTRESA